MKNFIVIEIPHTRPPVAWVCENESRFIEIANNDIPDYWELSYVDNFDDACDVMSHDLSRFAVLTLDEAEKFDPRYYHQGDAALFEIKKAISDNKYLWE